MSPDSAEALALRALAWIASDDELFGVFTGATGTGPGDIAARAADPEFLASVLDFLLMDDAWVIAFAGAESIPPDMPLRARAALPGGDAMHWT